MAERYLLRPKLPPEPRRFWTIGARLPTDTIRGHRCRPNRIVGQLNSIAARLGENVEKVIVGKSGVIESVLVAIFSQATSLSRTFQASARRPLRAASRDRLAARSSASSSRPT